MLFSPGLSGVLHHGLRSIVVLFVLVVEEHQFRPQVGLFSRTQNLQETNYTMFSIIEGHVYYLLLSLYNLTMCSITFFKAYRVGLVSI